MKRKNSRDNLEGQTYNKLTFIKRVESPKGRSDIFWEVECECGTHKRYSASEIIRGRKKDCGCSRETKQYIGQQYNNLTLIQKSNRKRRGRFLWKCLCTCGNITYQELSNIIAGRIKTCGTRRNHLSDYTGQTYNRLTILEETQCKVNKDGAVKRYYRCLCNCGKTTICQITGVLSGRIKSCGCLAEEQRKEGRSRKYHPVISSAMVIWCHYKEELSFDDFMRLTQQNCTYCGVPPSNIFNKADKAKSYIPSQYQIEAGNFVYNGLDRVDSNKKHTIDNVVPCCWNCNRMKSNMSLDDFLAHIQKICDFQVSIKKKAA